MWSCDYLRVIVNYMSSFSREDVAKVAQSDESDVHLNSNTKTPDFSLLICYKKKTRTKK